MLLRLSNLGQLTKLSMRSNCFKKLPPVVCSLPVLSTLDMADNRNIVSIDENLVLLQHLKELDCEKCFALRYPPYALCKQGLRAIRNYYK